MIKCGTRPVKEELWRQELMVKEHLEQRGSTLHKKALGPTIWMTRQIILLFSRFFLCEKLHPQTPKWNLNLTNLTEGTSAMPPRQVNQRRGGNLTVQYTHAVPLFCAYCTKYSLDVCLLRDSNLWLFPTWPCPNERIIYLSINVFIQVFLRCGFAWVQYGLWTKGA